MKVTSGRLLKRMLWATPPAIIGLALPFMGFAAYRFLISGDSIPEAIRKTVLVYTRFPGSMLRGTAIAVLPFAILSACLLSLDDVAARRLWATILVATAGACACILPVYFTVWDLYSATCAAIILVNAVTAFSFIANRCRRLRSRV